MKRKMVASAALCLALVFVGGGCWDREELENLGIILALGIDSLPGRRVEVTAQIAIPTQLSPGGGSEGGNGGAGPPTQVVTQAAENLFGALQGINRTVSRHLTLVQNRMIVFGEETAKKGLAPYLALVTRYRAFRRAMQIMIVKGSAKDALSVKPAIEQNPAEYLLDLSKLARSTGETDLVTVNDFTRRMESRGAAAYTSYLLPPEKGGGTGGTKKNLRIGGIAVFRGDRMAGVIEPEEVFVLLMLAGKFTGRYQTIRDPHDRRKNVVLNLTSAAPEIRPRLRGGKPSVAIDLKIEADLAEAETGESYLTGYHERMLEKSASAQLQEKIADVVRRVQTDLRTDVFGLGEYFRPLAPTWRDWVRLDWGRRFGEVPIAVNVRVFLRRFGFQDRPPAAIR